ncbi:MAG: S8 family serine peptidase [Bdellovibrionales bacterium]|nr:S8 family serine peptidase [Bdellovibrionales bacterium]
MNQFIKRSTLWVTFAILAICTVAPTSAWALDADSFTKIKQSLGFAPYYKLNAATRRKIKVAVFDNGFDGYEKALGKDLPADTTYVKGTLPSNEKNDTAHGRFMAEILYALMTNNGKEKDLAPELYLFKTTGFTNLKEAIDESIRLKVDVILHSMVREYGSNFDGEGFFNTEINRATSAGIIWVNAAGNFAKTTFNLKDFSTDDDGWIKLPGENQSLPIRCEKAEDKNNTNSKSNSTAKNDKKNDGNNDAKDIPETCDLRLVLSWNDFNNDPEVGTNKDLDLILTDDTLNILQTSNLTQTTDEKTAPGHSKYPREILEATIKPGRYFVRVKNRSKNFSSKDSLRITADRAISPKGYFISMENIDTTETLLNPADNPTVITVGATDSDLSSLSTKLNKPEILAPSLIAVSDQEAYLGSSNSAAIVAAGVALIKTQNEDLDREELIKAMTSLAYQNVTGEGLPTQVLGFSPTGTTDSDENPCFQLEPLQGPPPMYIRYILDRGGVLVRTSNALRIVTPFDPINLSPGMRRIQQDDIVVMTPEGLTLRPRREMIPPHWAEVFQLPQGTTTCSLPPSWMRYAQSAGKGKDFHLPPPAEIK